MNLFAAYVYRTTKYIHKTEPIQNEGQEEEELQSGPSREGVTR